MMKWAVWESGSACVFISVRLCLCVRDRRKIKGCYRKLQLLSVRSRWQTCRYRRLKRKAMTTENVEI